MQICKTATRSLRRSVDRAVLLAGVSAIALLTAQAANARPIGGRTPSPSAAAVAASQSGALEASRMARQAQNALKRATLSIQAIQASQAAAREAAKTMLSTIPNGLKPGGLQVAPGAVPGTELWLGADLPTEVANGERTKVTVKQNQQKAILTWETFNVGRETDLYFDQRAGGTDMANWIALNRVLDPTAAPSQILGSITAEGQVYVINGNGIVFGGASQVNVGTLVASSLSLSNQQFMAGINNPLKIFDDASGNSIAMPQFGYLGQQKPTGQSISNPGQVPGAVIGEAPGDVIVEAGAQITMASGGKAMMFAPHVTNAGVISAPDGQVILAAGEQIYLTTSTSVRGLDVAVSAPMRWAFAYYQLQGALGQEGIFDQFTYDLRDVILPEMEARAASVGYAVVNTGIVQADRGNITMMARDVIQNGALLATTALNNRDGSIRLLAWDQGMACYSSSSCEIGSLQYWSTGAVTLQPGSVTAVTPDLSDTSEIELAALATRYKPGRVELRGSLIDIEAQANVIVPAGTISIVASTSALSGDTPINGEPTVRDGSRVYIGEEAYLSVAGLQDVLIAMEHNIVEAELRINELRDSPLYRDSWLRGMLVYIDRRVSGVFADGPMAGVDWGGQAGAWTGTPLADVSAWIGVGKTDLAELSTVGGSILIKSSGSLITRRDSILDVSGGSVRYLDGWINTTRLLGADGRIYDIGEATPDRIYVGLANGFARSAGTTAQSWSGPLNKSGRRFEKGYTEGRAAGSIKLFAAEGTVLEGSYWGGVVVGERQAASGKLATAGTLTFGGTSDEHRQWLLGNLLISDNPVALPADFNATTPLSSLWYSGSPQNADSFRLRTTYLDTEVLAQSGMGKIDLYVATGFALEQGATLELRPGSSFSVSANSTPAYTQNFQIDGVIRSAGGTVRFLDAETLTFGSSAVIDVSGQWANSVTGAASALPPVINGGSVELMNAHFQDGAVIDVSGGGWYKMQGGKGKLQAGDAGDVALTGIDAGNLSNVDLRAYATGSGGRLSIVTSSSLQFGGETPVNAGAALLSESLFADRGFRSLTINTSGDIVVREGTTLTQSPVSVVPDADLANFASGTPITAIGQLAVLPLSERANLKPTSLSLTGHAVTIEENAVVLGDLGGAISIATRNDSTAGITIAGRLEALAGTISLASQGGTITVTDTGALVARGVPLIEEDGYGVRSGTVLNGGSVALDAARVELEQASMIDVSGASGVIDLPRSGQFGQNQHAPETLASNGGSLSIKGQGTIESTLYGGAGGAGARGGTVSLNASTSTVILSESAAGEPGLIVRPSVFQSAGFSDLTLSSTVRLEGVDLAFSGSISIGGTLVNGNGTSSRLAAPYISLFGPAASSPAHGGTLTLAASVIDVKQAYIRGFGQTVLEASDVRLIAPSLGQPAVLDVDGTLTLEAAQVYPTTQTSATVKATDKIVVQQSGTAGLALSVGGILTLEAPVIEQGGTLRAPFGQIVLKAGQELTLGAGSVTSVSGDGLILPYGNLSNNEYWTVPGTGTEPVKLSSLPEKRITLDAPNVDVAAGSVVDIRGGGDLFSWEHVPGPGGSHDVLTRPGVYAIVPVFGNAIATDSTIRAGDRIWLDGGSGLAAGWYALLPARYAMLPGAYAIQVVGCSQGNAVSQSGVQTDGSVIVSGYRGNAFDGTQESLASSWRVMSGDVVRKYSEYNEAFANTFFASDSFKLTQYRLTGNEIVTPRLPIDGGSLVLKATQDLVLNGTLLSQPAEGGRGGLVDIAVEKIAVVGTGHDAGALRADGYLVIDADNLSGFGAGSLLIGGIRSGDALGLRVDVTANDIVVLNDSNSALTGSEIILAASEKIEVAAGSVVRASGNAPVGAGDLVMAPQVPQVNNDNGTPADTTDDFVEPSRDWGALIRVSNGDVVRVRRENVDPTVGGQVLIGAGAVLDGGKALLIDATNNALVTGAGLSGTNLSLSSGRIGFGGGSGLVLDAAALAALANTQHLTLRSYSTIDFFTAVDLSGLSAVTLDSAALVGYSANHISVVANRLVLENTASSFTEPAGAGHGSLSLIADELAFGEGAKALRGFDTVAMSGTTRIVGEGKGTLDAGSAAVTLSAPVLTGRDGAGQAVTTTGALSIAASGTAPARDVSSLGARWTLTGGSIAFGGRIDALGGAVELNATNGDVVLADGSSIDVGGFAKQFFDVAEYADAGRISLKSLGGSVVMRSGAVLDLSGHAAGGGAGTLAVTSDGAGTALDGTIRAQVIAGARGGTFSLDIAELPDFAALNLRLNAAGFSESRQFRIRTGSVVVDGVTTVREFRLVADQGAVTITGTIDSRSRYGGEIAIYGGNGLTMTDTAVLRAGATETVDNLGSGRVTLGITGGSLNIQGGVIDVAGGEGGKVTLRAPAIEQAGSDTVNVAFAGSIAGAREIVLEGYKRFDLAALAANSGFVGVTVNGNGQAELDLAATTASKLNVLADYGAGTLVEFVQDFDISAVYGALGGLAAQSNFHARPGMELNYAGDIVLKSNWNLGAGAVDQASALAAGVMAIDPVLGKAYVVAGQEGRLLRDYTTMVYRTGGSILGESGVLTLRAEGDIELKGGISDGFFQFADTLDSDYIEINKTTASTLKLVLNGGRNNTSNNLTPYSSSGTTLPTYYAGISFSTQGILRTQTTTAPQVTAAPYNAEANTPAAMSVNALGNAVLFPSITKMDGTTVPASSWSETLVAGAVPVGASADPARRAAGSTASIVLNGLPTISYVSGGTVVNDTTLVDVDAGYNPILKPNAAGATVSPDSWLATLESAAGARLNADSSAAFNVGTVNEAGRTYLIGLWNAYAAAKGYTAPNDYRLVTASSRVNVVTKYSTFKDFYQTEILPNLRTITLLYSTVPAGATMSTLTPLTAVRTGTGDINVVAGGALRLNGGASIYTAGHRDLVVLDDFTTAPVSAAFGVGGGHLAITVGGNIDAELPADLTQMQHYTEWLKKQGATDLSYAFAPHNRPGFGNLAEQSAWWIDYGNFQRGVGALGGGNVDVSAGGDLDNLTVALPTNGRVRGGRTADEQKILELRNGGAMTVEAGGSVLAGYYYIGRGAGTIEASEFAVGREVTVTDRGVSTRYPIAPILSLGDATLSVRTAGDLMLQTVIDPLLVGKGQTYESAYMSGQTDRTALSLVSTGGDVTLVGQAQYLSKDLVFPGGNTGPFAYRAVNSLAGNLYPSMTRITALNGSVTNGGMLYTLPGTTPELRILAAGDVMPGSIVMSRATLEMLPSPFRPVGGSGAPIQYLSGVLSLDEVLRNDFKAPPPSNLAQLGHKYFIYTVSNPERLLNADDYEPSRVYALGSIYAGTIATNEQSWFRAGTDIRDIYYSLRNVHATDVSLLEAGNDIIGGTRAITHIQGGIRFGGQIEIQGPGALVLSAGRDVYGTDFTIFSQGNQWYDSSNRAVPLTEIFGLPAESASITVMAGLKGKQPSYDAFLVAYLDPANVAAMPDYLKTTLEDGSVVPRYFLDAYEVRKNGQLRKVQSGLISFIYEVTGEILTPQGAWARFQTLPTLTRERFLRQVYMQELREAGKDQSGGGTDGLPANGGYNRGYVAIQTLFPGDDWKGDVAIGNALFRTMAGGNIEVLTPGGGLQVAALGTPVGSNYGLVTLGTGDINIFTHNDVVVNRSRILTFGGGDEIIWSTIGDIDAGRGAKTARVPSAPEIVTDTDTVTSTQETPDISGSGIGTILGFSGVREGDMHLIAPEGTVNAGDAGIRVSGNLTLSARFVLNAANFDVAGEVKGMQLQGETTVNLKVDSGAQDKTAADAAKDATRQDRQGQPSIIIVEVLGFGGGEAPSEEQSGDERRKRTDQ